MNDFCADQCNNQATERDDHADADHFTIFFTEI